MEDQTELVFYYDVYHIPHELAFSQQGTPYLSRSARRDKKRFRQFTNSILLWYNALYDLRFTYHKYLKYDKLLKT